jgi:hypothetical protein
MAWVAALLGVMLVVGILWEGFEVIVLPRRVTRPYRVTIYAARLFWSSWKGIGRLLNPARREVWLSYYGPLSLLLTLVVWAVGVSLGFALLYWATGSLVVAGSGRAGLLTDWYFSAATFFTAGLAEVTPRGDVGRGLAVVEGALGFLFLALIIAYLPPINQSFSRREVSISLLDARGGSPPTAVEILRRNNGPRGAEALQELFLEWEHWAAELLESHQSYPMLAYFRSQHDNQSWLAALTSVLDSCALTMVCIEGACRRQAELTFAVARHAVVDLCLVFRRKPIPPVRDRLKDETWAKVRERLGEAGVKVRQEAAAAEELADLRARYEPYVNALSRFFVLELPPWVRGEVVEDDWQVSEWEERRRPPAA